MRAASLLLILASTAAAGFLPLIHDRPKRDNPADPRVQPRSLPVVVFPTYTPTPTPLPACGGPDTANYATFEAGVEAWTYETYAGYTQFTPPLTAAAPSCFGSQALVGSAGLVHAGGTLHLAFKKLPSPALNWTGRALAARFYFPPGYPASSANLYIKVTGSWTSRSGGAVSAPAGGGWAALTFDLGGLAPAESADVREVGVDIFSGPGDPDGTVTYRLDSFNILGGPTPTITPSFSASPTVALGSPTPTPTASPTLTPTPSPLPTCGAATDTSSFATFEAGTETWVAESYSGYTFMTVTASTPACLGAQALCGAANLVHGGATLHLAFKKNFASVDWTGRGLEARLYAPAGYGASSAALYIKTGASYTTHQGPVTALPAGGGYVTLAYGLGGLAPADAADVRELGVDIFSGSGDPDGAMSYCLDAVSLR